MHSPNLFIGTFNTENHWRPRNLAELPSFSEPEALNVIASLDELQFTFCNDKSDLLITRHPFHKDLKQFLVSIGIDFKSNEDSFGMSIQNALETDLVNLAVDSDRYSKYKHFFSKPRNFSPYSILPHTKQFCEVYDLEASLPDINDVVKVNSKVYSTILGKEFSSNTKGEYCSSSTEFLKIGSKLLSEYPSFLLKDPFGVSGKGNIHIGTAEALKRIHATLNTQEAAGKDVSFVIEPLLPKKIDFSCLLDISKNGDVTILAVQQILNNGFAYLGTQALKDDTIKLLERVKYFEQIISIGKTLYQDKYHGPVCVDSMILENDDVIPIIEINARKSMGYINYHLRTFIGKYGKRSLVMNLSLIVPGNFCYEALLYYLENNASLYSTQTCEGILPLSANTMVINNNLNKKERNLGRFYYAVISDSTASMVASVLKLFLLLKNMQVKVLQEKQIVACLNNSEGL